MNRPLLPVAVSFLLVLILLDAKGSILHPKIPTRLESSLNERGLYRVRVIEPPEPDVRGSKVIVETEGVKVRLTLPFIPDWGRGDEIEFDGRLKRPTHYKNPGAFDYRRDLARQGILLSSFIPTPDRVTLIKKGEGGASSWPTSITAWRRRISGTIFKHLTSPSAGFLAALFVGDRSGLSDELWQAFRVTGTAHLIAISGQHVAIVGLAFYAVFLWFLKRSTRLLLLFSVRRIALLLALIPIWFYTFLAGAPPSALRAAVMASLIPLAFFLKREVDSPSALAAAAILVALWDPAAPFSPSYQLSFLAVLGILVFRPSHLLGPHWFQKYLYVPFFMTIGATLATAPLVAYRFNQISFSGLWNNFWAIPACGFLLVAAPILLLLHLYPAANFLTDLFLKGITTAARHPFSFSLYPTGTEMILGYGLVILAALLFHKKIRLSAAAIVGAGLLVGFVPSSSLFPEKKLEVTFLDVGQGDGAVVVAPSGKVMLIDAGGFLIPGQGPPAFDVGERVVIPYLGGRGIRRIDKILLSHPHPDHYGGLNAVLSRLPVGEFWWNGQTFPDSTFDDLTAQVEKIPHRVLHAGDRISWEGMELEILYPQSVDFRRNINDNSLVMRLRYGDVSFLFTGDIEKQGEKFLAGLPEPIAVDVLKVPHHGSRTSSSPAFIEKFSPHFVVASLGEANPFHFPHPGVLERYQERGIQIFRTDQDGAVTLMTDGKQITTKTAASDFR